MSGTCACGKVRLEALTKPMVCTNCHCTVCRENNKNRDAYGIGIYWRPALTVSGPVKSVTSKSFRRDSCAACGDPVAEWGLGVFYSFASASSKILGLTPTCNIHYSSGRGKGTDNLTTIYSDIGSSLYMILIACTFGALQLPRLVWANLTYYTQSQPKNE